MNPDELTLYEAAAEVGISRRALQARLWRGRMQGRRVAGLAGRPRWLIPRTEVERWKDVRRVGHRVMPSAPEAERRPPLTPTAG